MSQPWVKCQTKIQGHSTQIVSGISQNFQGNQKQEKSECYNLEKPEEIWLNIIGIVMDYWNDKSTLGKNCMNNIQNNS